MKFHLLFLVLPALGLALSGCGPTARETELEKENQALTLKLKTVEVNASAAQAALDARLKVVQADLDVAQKRVAELENQAKGDVQYQVLRKEYIEGKFMTADEVDPITNKKIAVRVNPRWLVYFQGVQTNRAYPGIEMLEATFKQFIEGAVYTREDINRAKK